MIKLNKIIRIDDQRIFIDIAREGCGNGCKYCYVDTAEKEQVLWSEKQILEGISELESMEEFRQKGKDYIVSLCPSTEPLKNENACKLIKLIIEKLARYGCFFQIATKERVKKGFLEEIDSLLVFEGQLHINLSINCFSLSQKLEPNAIPAEERIKNVANISELVNIKSCILIKPFIAATYDDMELFKKNLKRYLPDYVCIGISFFKNHCVNEKDNQDFFEEHFANQDTEKIYLFMKELENALGMPVYPSTLCVINQYSRGFIKPNISRTRLCNQCGKCGTNDK